ncbi:NADH-quinone oxidoreductase subunit J [Evansella cellulosilytica]|uniref:NADH-quinone oxidoreductase subunit J n=1 Tax=Evansella cellulosilytica (strain ATCC 21833 / DSM 2522 / FERM P-1141 / JCM 9156 / N-4) TaxID=649639 RepID=E6TX94_EVAC2|nr:NADH-quinone oxidoreductase subunit J [Evansella cellulosilytica]ADU32289.1 NADH-ubiquinone/plastoquinone oxidoreductase chain 6 [Evansella cellulosilytica DSM 2522]
MNTQMIIFLILAILAIACSVLVLQLRRISHRVVSMAFVFFAIAGLYFLLGADFIGIIQIIVYAGAVTILFIFGMMMTEHRNVTFSAHPRRAHRVLSFIGVATLLGFMLYGILGLDLPASEPYEGTAEAIGLELYGHYVVAFLAMGFLLTAALIGAIVIARKEAE